MEQSQRHHTLLTTMSGWSVDDVAKWVTSLPLSRNYSTTFTEKRIDGEALQQHLSIAALDELGVTNPSDRLLLLQNIVLMGDSPLSSVLDSPTTCSLAESTSTGSSLLESLTTERPIESLSTAAATVGSSQSTQPHLIQAFPVNQNKRKQHPASRSFDEGLMVGDWADVATTSPVSSHLLDILREDNAALKKELESYYERVRKLQKLEQELERLREAHMFLEATAQRKEQVEEAMRRRLEEEIRRLKETNCHQKVEIHTVRRAASLRASPPDDTMKKELARRDSMIKRLIIQNNNSNRVRERLEKDLYNARAAIEEKQSGSEKTENSASVDSTNVSPTTIEDATVSMYCDSMNKLRTVLLAMQSSSAKRADLEAQLRNKLEMQLKQLQGGKETDKPEDILPREKVQQLETIVLRLQTEVAKWEQRCLELTADKQLTLDAVVIPRDTKISNLQQQLRESSDTIKELRDDRLHYMTLYQDTNKKHTKLKNRISSLEASLKEKETLVHTLQSLLEPDTSIGNSFTSSSSPSTIRQSLDFPATYTDSLENEGVDMMIVTDSDLNQKQDTSSLSSTPSNRTSSYDFSSQLDEEQYDTEQETNSITQYRLSETTARKSNSLPYYSTLITSMFDDPVTKRQTPPHHSFTAVHPVSSDSLLSKKQSIANKKSYTPPLTHKGATSSIRKYHSTTSALSSSYGGHGSEDFFLPPSSQTAKTPTRVSPLVPEVYMHLGSSNSLPYLQRQQGSVYAGFADRQLRPDKPIC